MPILTKAQIIEAVRELPEADRSEVIETLNEQERPLVLTEEYRREIERRIAAHHADPSQAISREQLTANLDALR